MFAIPDPLGVDLPSDVPLLPVGHWTEPACRRLHVRVGDPFVQKVRREIAVAFEVGRDGGDRGFGRGEDREVVVPADETADGMEELDGVRQGLPVRSVDQVDAPLALVRIGRHAADERVRIGAGGREDEEDGVFHREGLYTATRGGVNGSCRKRRERYYAKGVHPS